MLFCFGVFFLYDRIETNWKYGRVTLKMMSTHNYEEYSLKRIDFYTNKCYRIAACDVLHILVHQKSKIQRKHENRTTLGHNNAILGDSLFVQSQNRFSRFADRFFFIS